MDIFWFAWPETLFCDSFPDSSDPNVCLGFAEAHEPPTLEGKLEENRRKYSLRYT